MSSLIERIRTVEPTIFSVTIRQAGPISLVDVSGRLTSFEVGALRDSVSRLLKQGREKHRPKFKRSPLPGQFRDRRAGENLCLSGQRRRRDEGRWLVAESGTDPQDYATLSSFPGIPERRGGIKEFSRIRPK